MIRGRAEVTLSTESGASLSSEATPKRTTAGRLGGAMVMGGIGVLFFSFTLPATHISVPVFGGVIVGLGRAMFAAILAAGVLLVRREPFPARHTWRGLFAVVLGVVIGFPLLSALALVGAPVAHSAVINGLLPAATAILAVIRTDERPSILFWLSCAAGTTAVIAFALLQGGGHLQMGDWLMVGAVAVGALGYAEGGRLAREMGGWRVICWALVLAAPFIVPPVVWLFAMRGVQGTPVAWAGLAYVSIFSSFLGFFAWYRGLALGGIARVSQIQLLQPILTIAWAALLLGEPLTPAIGVTAVFVAACVALGQRTRLSGTAK